MQWNVHQEFAVVADLLTSTSRSKGVDAFALSLLKAERHARRMFTYLIFQNPSFDDEHISQLRTALVEHETFAFASALAGIDLISPYTLTHLCGDHHATLLSLLPKIKKRRNKIFHGQLTHESLSTQELTDMATALMDWSISLAKNCSNKLGYDGFESSSFVKHSDAKFANSLKRQLISIVDYTAFIKESHQAGKAKP